MSASKRSEPKRRTAASRPGRAGPGGRGGPRRSAVPRRGSTGPRAEPERLLHPIKRSIVAAAERRSELRVGFTARRAAILATMVCVLTLTIAGPVRTFFAQHTEMKQQAKLEATLRQQIIDLQQQQARLADPAHIKAEARERLGFVMPGEIPYQVQLPPAVDVPAQPWDPTMAAPSGEPWYAALWHTIADAPHGLPSAHAPPAPAIPGD